MSRISVLAACLLLAACGGDTFTNSKTLRTQATESLAQKNFGIAADKAYAATLKAPKEAESWFLLAQAQAQLGRKNAAMGAARGKHKVGLANGSEGSGYEGISRIFHTKSIPLDPRTHAVARGRLVVGAALGFKVDYPADFGLPEVPASEPRPEWMGAAPYAVFFHGTARDAKKWTPANWIELGKALAPMPVLLP